MYSEEKRKHCHRIYDMTRLGKVRKTGFAAGVFLGFKQPMCLTKDEYAVNLNIV